LFVDFESILKALGKRALETTKTLISVDFESISKALGKTLLKNLEKRALETQGRVSQMIILICGWRMNHHS
jgi:hypothetical protein